MSLKFINTNKILWLMVVVAIPLMSIFGRGMQGYMFENFSKKNIVITVGAILALMCIYAIYGLVKNHAYSRMWHLLWFIPLFIVLPYNFPIIEERFHFIIFGLFGYLNARLFSIRIAFAVCVSASVLDEALQWYLPDRVGDWHDVGINLLASVAGAVFSYISMKKNNAY